MLQATSPWTAGSLIRPLESASRMTLSRASQSDLTTTTSSALGEVFQGLMVVRSSHPNSPACKGKALRPWARTCRGSCGGLRHRDEDQYQCSNEDRARSLTQGHSLKKREACESHHSIARWWTPHLLRKRPILSTKTFWRLNTTARWSICATETPSCSTTRRRFFRQILIGGRWTRS